MQVLINLVNNAIDAVSYSEDKWIRILTECDDEFVVISVIDSGPAIPEEIKDKILNVFFTTKELGKGTGLGLSISQRIIRDHGGNLLFDRKSEHTCFKIVLPLIQMNTMVS